ncbi:hypothetical protein [Burkholderia gladioli]|uniref:hypothetical protein n=1 Tax=Burkholderia gladioli TaxID=28095 RepID=UPI00163FBCE5|nr:hypothetical protein [Burkholderia gladioli]
MRVEHRASPRYGELRVVAGFDDRQRAQVGQAQRQQLDRADQQLQPRHQSQRRGVHAALHAVQQMRLVGELVAGAGRGDGPGEPLDAAIDEGERDPRGFRQAAEALLQPA